MCRKWKQCLYVPWAHGNGLELLCEKKAFWSKCCFLHFHFRLGHGWEWTALGAIKKTFISFKILSFKSWLLGSAAQPSPVWTTGQKMAFMTQARRRGSRQAGWAAVMRRCLWMFCGIEFNGRELIDMDLHLKAGCIFFGAAEIFGNGVPWLKSSTPLWTSVKMLLAGHKLQDQYQVCDLYTNTAI